MHLHPRIARRNRDRVACQGRLTHQYCLFLAFFCHQGTVHIQLFRHIFMSGLSSDDESAAISRTHTHVHR